MEKLPYGEDINYWQTGASSPDTWMERTKKQIIQLGGSNIHEAFGSDAEGRAAFMIAFEIKGDKFKIVWPVLPSRKENNNAAKKQAATMLYHEVKARCISATVLGHRTAFFSYMLLPDGRTASQLSGPDLIKHIPTILIKEK